MKIEYKNNLYMKYLKQRLMFLYGWVNEERTYKGQSWYEEGMREYKEKIASITDIEVLEQMLFNIKDFYNLSEQEAREAIGLESYKTDYKIITILNLLQSLKVTADNNKSSLINESIDYLIDLIKKDRTAQKTLKKIGVDLNKIWSYGADAYKQLETKIIDLKCRYDICPDNILEAYKKEYLKGFDN